jgi:hypothetical protein
MPSRRAQIAEARLQYRRLPIGSSSFSSACPRSKTRRNQHLLLQCEYLVSGRLRLSDPARSTLAEIAKHLGRKYLVEVAALPNRTQSWPGIAF